MVCTFFGHRDAPSSLEDTLKEAIIRLIQQEKVDVFYVGNQGKFDAMVRRVLKMLLGEFPHIRYAVVLAYMPTEKDKGRDFSDTLFPDSLESVPRRAAIAARNRWMIEKAEYVIAYAKVPYGGAADAVALAEKKGKTIIHI